MRAVEVVVRGFGSVGNGSKLQEALEEMYFHVRTNIDGSSDSMGGIIETEITKEDHLNVAVVRIKDMLHAVLPLTVFKVEVVEWQQAN